MKKPSDTSRPAVFTRRNALRLLAGGAVTVTGAATDAFWLEPRRLSVTRRDISCPGLAAALDGLRIALIADIHFRPGKDDALLEKVVTRVKSERPDLIALAGDYMGGDPGVVGPMLEHLGGMAAAHGLFAVRGNHDGWAGRGGRIQRQFEKAGISFLINRNTNLSIRGENLVIAGTDFVWSGNPDPVKTLAGISPETPVIALVHEPDYFDTMIRHRPVTLQLSGHTHGGQCRVPLLGIAPVKVKYGERYIHGHFQRGTSNLFVTRGIGTSGLPVRFACPPELAMLTLKAGTASVA